MARTGLPIVAALACVALFASAAFVASRDETGRTPAPAAPPENAVATRTPRVPANADGAPTATSDAAPGAIPRPHALNGTVREKRGRALAGAVVRAEPMPVFPNVPEHRVAVEATADADGAFGLRDLSAGDWTLSVSADGGTPRIVPRRAGPFDAGVTDAVVDVVAGLTLRGAVRDLDGVALEGAEVTVVATGPTRRLIRKSARADGTFEIDGLPAGVLVLDVWSAACLRPPTLEVRGGAAPLDLRLDRGLAIAGVVLDADGKPHSFGNLSAESVDADTPAEARVIKADAAGAFRVTGLTRGRWKIVSGYNTTLAEEPVVEAGASHVEVRCAAPPKKDDEAK